MSWMVLGLERRRRAGRDLHAIDDTAEVLLVLLEIAWLLVRPRRGQVGEERREVLHFHRRDA